MCEKDGKSKDSQSNSSENKISPQPIWQFLSAKVTEDFKGTGMWAKNNPKINTLRDFSEVLHFRENENKNALLITYICTVHSHNSETKNGLFYKQGAPHTDSLAAPAYQCSV